MAKKGGELWIGPAGDNGMNPYDAGGGEFDYLHADAKGDYLFGEDDRRIGVGLMSKAEVEVLAGQGSERRTTPTLFGLNFQSTAEVEGDIGGAGVGAGGWLYYDKQQRRYRIGALGELVAGFGGEFNLDISFGAAYVPPGGAPGTALGTIPNQIALGFQTVLIG